MKKTLGAVLFSVVALIGSPAQSALIDQGANTLDTGTGLEWLDITATVGLSYNAVLGTAYVTAQGYRYATEAEVLQLYADAGGIGSQSGPPLAGNTAPAQLLLQLMGCTSYLVGAPCDGIPEDWSAAMWGGSSQFIGLIDHHPGGGILRTRWASFGNDNSPFRPDVGAFLVREAQEVVEPGTAMLLAIGLAGIGFRRRTA